MSHSCRLLVIVRSFPIFFASAFVLSGFNAPAFAQSSNASGILEEIVVTATRREVAIQDVPIAVTAIDRKRLEDLQVQGAMDLQRYVPTLNMFNNITSPTNISPSLRGMLQQDASLVTAESPFAIYVDDIYVGRLNGNNVTLSDIERVEVLRGPQGTLYGRNAAAGAIKFVSRMPGEDTWADAAVGAGNDDQFLVRASGGGPLGAGFAGSLSGQWIEKDGQYYNLAEDSDVDSQENLTLRGKLRYMGLENFDAVLTVSYSDSENDSLQMPNGKTPDVQSDCRPAEPGFVAPCTGDNNAQFTSHDIVLTNGDYTVNTATAPLGGPLAPSPLGAKPHGRTEQNIVGLNLSYDINDNMAVRSITGYVGLDDFFQTDFNGNSADPTEFFPVLGASDIDSDQYSQEFQLLGAALDDKLSYLVGAFYMHEEADQEFGWNLANDFLFVPLGPQAYLPISNSNIHTETDSISVFGDATYRTDFGLGATVGMRWTDDDKDFDYDFTGGGAPTTNITLSQDDSELTPRFVLDYMFDPAGDVIDGAMVYTSAAKGYKGGGFSAIAIFSTAPIGTYSSETNWTYEGGFKADWFGHRVRTNLAYFWSDINDIQQNSTDASVPGAPEFPVENSGDAEIRGLEFEISAIPFSGLNLFLTGAFMNGKYKNLDPDSSAAAARVIYGVEPKTPQTPDYSFDAGFDYTFNFSGNLMRDLSFGADYYKTDDYIVAATNDFRNSGWDQWNAFISMSVADNWQLQFTGKNLGDDANVVSGSRSLGGFIYLPSREFLFTVTYRMQ
jgi:iron complex outermembrane receptor protein